MKKHEGIFNAHTKWKKSIRKSCILYNSNYKEFWKRQSCEDDKKISGCQGGSGGEEQIEHRELLRQWKYSVF